MGFLTFVLGYSGVTLYVLNSQHEFVAWLVRLGSDAGQGQEFIRQKQPILLEMIGGCMPGNQSSTTIKELDQFVRGFRSIPGLPKELHPPDITLTDDMFRIKPGDKLLPLPDGIANA